MEDSPEQELGGTTQEFKAFVNASDLSASELAAINPDAAPGESPSPAAGPDVAVPEGVKSNGSLFGYVALGVIGFLVLGLLSLVLIPIVQDIFS